MKRVERHYSFIYYTKYKSSRAIVIINLNQITHTKKLLKLLIYQNALFGCSLSFIDSQHSFHQRLEVDWKQFCPVFLQELPEVSRIYGLFCSDFLVKFIPHKLDGILVRSLKGVLCFKCTSSRVHICFGLFWGMSTNPWPTSRVPDKVMCCCSML